MKLRLFAAASASIIALAACGSSIHLSGPERSATVILHCLRTDHLDAEVMDFADTGVLKKLGITALVSIVNGAALAQEITVYRDRADAASSFSLHAAHDPELLDGNTILEITGYTLPPASRLLKRIELCAFGSQSAPKQSAYYTEAYPQRDSGHAVMLRSGCLGCHMIGAAGNNGPGPNLTRIGTRLTAAMITDVLKRPIAPMPSFGGLERTDPRAWRALISYLTRLGK